MKIKKITRKGAWQIPKLLNHYRYRLGFEVNEKGKGRILFVCLNPSTASLDTTDTTVDVFCKSFAIHNGFKELEIVNLFAYRSKDKKKLLNHIDVIGPENNQHILDAVNEADKIVIAYGKYFHNKIRNRANDVCQMIKNRARCPICVIKLNKDGSQTHPLYKDTHKDFIPITKIPLTININ